VSYLVLQVVLTDLAQNPAGASAAGGAGGRPTTSRRGSIYGAASPDCQVGFRGLGLYLRCREPRPSCRIQGSGPDLLVWLRV
jgi:hypothetical protein